jgi:hypothetical protein
MLTPLKGRCGCVDILPDIVEILFFLLREAHDAISSPHLFNYHCCSVVGNSMARLIVLLLGLGLVAVAGSATSERVKSEFLWGVATSAYQIEVEFFRDPSYRLQLSLGCD